MRYIDQAPQFVQLHHPRPGATHPELIAGLLATPARIAPKFFYDALGSRLFDAITELPEYYPTRTEAAVFAEHGADMARHVPQGAVLVDLGAGSCAKAARLFPVLQPSAYVPVDISVDYLRDTLAALQQRHADLPMLGLGMDFSTRFALGADVTTWLSERALAQQPRVVFYPGSSIGNFLPDEALALLCQAHAVCEAAGAGGGLLIGVDRVKPRAVLEPAYDDALGVTAAFNRNLLRHVNRLIDADFAPAAWQHVGLYNADESRIEMHLQSIGDQTVRWTGGERRFADGERLHTENSYKWAPEDFGALLGEAGFGAPRHWTDANGWFSVFWAPA
ncbi:MAG: L-histidine N(alpha)-methyltransferase [Hydrogenophaga sp.]|jgi:L-histidine Nalpha-methyltransferase|uniref:L-histidine N(alpha)-methyltransferase n=1 Tax=Hydrogenophaga sp. TaxID=1904254 RepID=UPI002610F31A|nr:L-histidine N(alpha)-methyltransferase [Hydrogenophaga sp.]MCW5668199.1 L-histidine N(alpha)-methyltransferase [Hydrogenophaga sp.]